jgi:hypothetical protein
MGTALLITAGVCLLAHVMRAINAASAELEEIFGSDE